MEADKIWMHKSLLKAIWHVKSLSNERERLTYFINYGIHSGEDLAREEFKLKNNKDKLLYELDVPINQLYIWIDDQAANLGYTYKTVTELEQQVLNSVKSAEESAKTRNED